MSDRRDFIKATAVGAIGLAALPSIESIAAATAPPAPTKHELPPLPYAYNALEPHIDAQTMQLHHDKHHAAYVAGLNKAEEELAKARATGDFALIQHWSKQAAFHGGGHYLHSMFWTVMAPAGKGGGGEPTGALKDLIVQSFGSFDAFKKQLSAAAAAVEGSGWGLVHYRSSDRSLIILQAENQHKLTSWGSTPVLGIDVWEHAYYLKYQNKRADYIAAWWNVVNWEEVARRVAKAG